MARGNGMIQEFVIFYLLFWWVMSIIYKENWIQGKLEDIGHWFKQGSFLNNFFLDLSECNFCIESHTATVGAVLYFSYCLDYRVLIWGFLCASINSWMRTFME
jgi:hypothetical protein